MFDEIATNFTSIAGEFAGVESAMSPKLRARVVGRQQRMEIVEPGRVEQDSALDGHVRNGFLRQVVSTISTVCALHFATESCPSFP